MHGPTPVAGPKRGPRALSIDAAPLVVPPELEAYWARRLIEGRARDLT